MGRTSISDRELLELIRKNADVDRITDSDARVTEKRLQEFFDRLEAVIQTESKKGRAAGPSTRRPQERIRVYTDGASRGNPGRAGIGVVICDMEQNVLEKINEYIGETTNNMAEYRALICGVERARRYSPKEVEIFSDSELMVKQLNGQYKVRAPSILPLYREARRLIETLPRCRIHHIPREKNALADSLANMALDAKSGRKGP